MRLELPIPRWGGLLMISIRGGVVPSRGAHAGRCPVANQFVESQNLTALAWRTTEPRLMQLSFAVRCITYIEIHHYLIGGQLSSCAGSPGSQASKESFLEPRIRRAIIRDSTWAQAISLAEAARC